MAAVVLLRPQPVLASLAVTVLDADTGRLRNEGSLRCEDEHCHDWAFDVGTDGSLVAMGIGTTSARLMRADPVLFQAPSPLLAQQAAFNGAWYASETSGQGFTLRVQPRADGNAMLFMPWFTSTREGGNEPDALRWYVLETLLTPETKDMEIPVFQTRGGQFNAPGFGREQVGTAHLRFVSCDTGLFEYQINDGEEALQGSMALGRVLPMAEDCVQADGSVVTASVREELALSGTWYDPAHPGQGLEIQHVRSDAQGGEALFGAWYTYDPGVPSGDASDQHWFTLQAAEPNQSGLRAGIYQTLGGRFDANATNNVMRVGEVDLLPVSCESITLHYRFDDTASAHAFRGRQGELVLHRLGGDCST